MKALVLGLGVSGESAARLLIAKGFQVTCVDGNEAALEKAHSKGLVACPDTTCFDPFDFQCVILSPGWNPKHVLCALAREKGIEMIGEAELAFRHLPRSQRCLAITGTNGKTTVTLLCEHILNASGKFKARALGNVGVPLSDYVQVADPDEIVVAELSSYQLETMSTPVFSGGVILNVTPDHLDRYHSMREYAEAKCRLKLCLSPDAPLYVYEKVQEEFGFLLQTMPYRSFGRSPSCSAWTDRKKMVDAAGVEVQLPEFFASHGFHESENALAAWLLCSLMGINGEEFIAALKTFRKPAHRIEFVKTINGVSYYDDSKGTNIDAVVQAVAAMQGPVVLIAGGVDKGASYAPWISLLKDRVKQIIAIGQAAEKMCLELQDAFKMERAESLSVAVHLASVLASEGDNVLLSPGCSSLDMFRDYAHRGDEFKRFVHNLDLHQERR